MKTFIPITNEIWNNLTTIVNDYTPCSHYKSLKLFWSCTNDGKKLGIDKFKTATLFFLLNKKKECGKIIDVQFIYNNSIEYLGDYALDNIPPIENKIFSEINTFIKSQNVISYSKIIKRFDDFMNVNRYYENIIFNDTINHLDCSTFIISEIVRKYGLLKNYDIGDIFIHDTIIKYILCFFTEKKIEVPYVNNNIWEFLYNYVESSTFDDVKITKKLSKYYNFIGINNNLEFTKYLRKEIMHINKIDNISCKLYDLTVKFIENKISPILLPLEKKIDYIEEIKNLETKILILKNQINFIKDILKLLPNYEINGSFDYLKIDTSFNIDKLKALDEAEKACQKELESLKNKKEMDDIINRIKCIANKDLKLVIDVLKELNKTINVNDITN